jgi:hypothetical protein
MVHLLSSHLRLFSFMVLPSGFSSYKSLLISNISRSQEIHIYLITLKLPVSYRGTPVTRMATRSPTATVEISIRIRNHVTAITWWVVTLFWNRLGTWGQSITSQITMVFRHRYKTQPVNSACVSPSAYVGSCKIWYSPRRILLVLLLYTVASFVLINITL